MTAAAAASASAPLAQLADGTLITGTDPRARLHVIIGGAVACGAPVAQLAEVSDLANRKMCFFCDGHAPAQAEPEAEIAEPVTLRIAEALINHISVCIGSEFADAAAVAPTRRVGRGATYFVTLPRPVAHRVADHLTTRLAERRTGLPIERFRAERALRMIQSDLQG